MNIVGLVVEYNPLHNGHAYHIEQARKGTNADAVVIVMSGNFLQRGEPALVNKWARTRMALAAGVDLVLELPYVYATQQAQHFAFGAVSLLNRLPFVTHLCFGSESGEINTLQAIAQIIFREPEEFKVRFSAEIKKGVSYPRAYAEALAHLLTEHHIDSSLYSQPNNILGLHYILGLLQLQSTIIPTTIKREKAGYHDEHFSDTQIASATSIRKALFSSSEIDWKAIKPYVPQATFDILQEESEAGRAPISWESYYPYLMQALYAQSATHLHSLYEMEEGIEHRFKEKAQLAQSVEHLCQLVKTKRYTWNRIQRMLVHTLTQFTKADAAQLLLEQGPTYIRLLGYSKVGKRLLNSYKKELSIPLLSSIRRQHPAMLDWDIKASQLYTLGYRSHAMLTEKRREVQQPPLTIL